MLKMGAWVCKSRSRSGHECRKTAQTQCVAHLDGVSGHSEPRNANAQKEGVRCKCAVMAHVVLSNQTRNGALHLNWALLSLDGLMPGKWEPNVPVTGTAISPGMPMCDIRYSRQPQKVTFRFSEQRGRTPAKSCHRTISGSFRCIGATGDCPRHKGQIRLRRSDFCHAVKSPVTTTNKGNQP